jgi:DNA-binding transcriptional LysR family regulator
MELDDLVAFITVAESGGFARAGDRLGVAQSVVSKRIMRLEAELGGRLIDRSVRTRIALTREGAMFLPEARKALAQAQHAVRIGQNLLRGELGPLRIGFVFSAIMTGLVADIARTLEQHVPAISPEFRMSETPEQLRALSEGRLDVGLLRPRLSYPDGTTARIVHTETLVVGMHWQHPLSQAASVSGAQIAGETLIMPQFHEEVGLIDTVKAIAEQGGFAVPDLIRTDDFVTAAALSAAGLGIVLAPASLTRLTLPNLVYCPLRETEFTVQIALVCRNDMPKRVLALLMKDDLR